MAPELKRTVRDHDGEINPTRDIVVGLNVDDAYKLLLWHSHFDESIKFETNNENYKVKCSAKKDDCNVEFGVEVTKIDEKSSCIEFLKKKGPIMSFHKIIAEYRKMAENPEGDSNEDKKEA